MIVIEDYYHMTTIIENVNSMKLTHLLLIFPLNYKAPFVHLPLLEKFECPIYRITSLPYVYYVH